MSLDVSVSILLNWSILAHNGSLVVPRMSPMPEGNQTNQGAGVPGTLDKKEFRVSKLCSPRYNICKSILLSELCAPCCNFV